MAIYVTTKNPQELKETLMNFIEDQKIPTWSIDNEGDLTYVSQWKNKAWFKSQVDAKKKRLIFGLIGRKDENMTKSVYGIYHGRFSEMLLTHFDTMIEGLELTPKGIKGVDSFN